VNGCTGTVRFQLVVTPQQSVELGKSLFASDHPGVISVVSPRSVPRALRVSLASDKLRIVVRGHGRFGNARTSDETVRAAEPRKRK
jgi:hypothetical protein